MGVAIAISTSVVLITLLHLAILHKTVQFTIPIKDMFKMVVLVGATYSFGFLLKSSLFNHSKGILSLILILIILTIIYLILLFALRFITEEELKQIPLVNKLIKN